MTDSLPVIGARVPTPDTYLGQDHASRGNPTEYRRDRVQNTLGADSDRCREENRQKPQYECNHNFSFALNALVRVSARPDKVPSIRGQHQQ